VPDAEGGYRVELTPIDMPDGRFVLTAATSLHDDAEMLGNARLAMGVAIPVALLLAWVGGWLLARRSLAPMVDIREATATISASNLRERVPIANPDDEVGQLATVINGLLDRLEWAFAQQRQFMADASHELRTPVTVVQNEASRALSRRERSAAEYEDALSVVQTAARRLRRIVDDLFLLARADAGELPVARQPLYLDEIVAECGREVRSLAAQRGLELRIEAPDEVPYDGDEALLRRLVINLLDNAIKYSSAGTAIDVRLRRGDGRYELEVRNAGPPIPPELREPIFERFIRGDATRTRSAADEADTLASGAGLGLSIARWIAAAHGGTLELERSDASGTVFVLSLPAEAA
jgi:heavy metal sensor kinase